MSTNILSEIEGAASSELEDELLDSYSTEDALMLISNYTTIKDSFLQAAANVALETGVENGTSDIGLVVSDGPDSHEEHITAYMRTNPDDADEYVQLYGFALGFTHSEVVDALKQYEDSGQNTKSSAVASLYITIKKYGNEITLEQLSETTEVPENQILESVQDYENRVVTSDDSTDISVFDL